MTARRPSATTSRPKPATGDALDTAIAAAALTGSTPPASIIRAPALLGADALPDGVSLLTRVQIDTAQDIRHRYVEVPSWGGWVRLKSMTGRERDQFDAETYAIEQKTKSNLTDFRCRRVARSIVDENDVRLYTDAEVEALGQKDGAVIDMLDDIVVVLSGLDQGAVERAAAALKAVTSDGTGSA